MITLALVPVIEMAYAKGLSARAIKLLFDAVDTTVRDGRRADPRRTSTGGGDGGGGGGSGGDTAP